MSEGRLEEGRLRASHSEKELELAAAWSKGVELYFERDNGALVGDATGLLPCLVSVIKIVEEVLGAISVRILSGVVLLVSASADMAPILTRDPHFHFLKWLHLYNAKEHRATAQEIFRHRVLMIWPLRPIERRQRGTDPETKPRAPTSIVLR